MNKKSETVTFFGSGPVAAESLRLLAKHCTIEAVITKPTPSHHRGDVPVATLAEELSLPVYTAQSKESLNNLFATHPVGSSLAVLIDFGILVSQQIIDYFPLGIINSHFSLLPEWRGADPITFAILSGQKRTGVSLMLLTAGMDEGPLLAQGEYEIAAHTTTPQLTHALIMLSDSLLTQTLPLYVAGKLAPVDQLSASIGDSRHPTYSRKLTKEDGKLDWRKPASVLEREIRAFQEWPKSRAFFGKGKLEVIITVAQVIDVSGTPGETGVISKEPIVYCGKQALILSRVKPAGKSEMTGQAFLVGYRQLFLA